MKINKYTLDMVVAEDSVLNADDFARIANVFEEKDNIDIIISQTDGEYGCRYRGLKRGIVQLAAYAVDNTDIMPSLLAITNGISKGFILVNRSTLIKDNKDIEKEELIQGLITHIKRSIEWIENFNPEQTDKQPLIVNVVNKGNQPLPEYATAQSAGMDLRANIEAPITLKSLERVLIPTGLHIALPDGYEAQVRPRSGLAIKHGITCLNTPGTIDADYRGEIGVELVNLSREDFTIQPGERIAQMIINKFEKVKFELVEELDKTERGEGGFGHTGLK